MKIIKAKKMKMTQIFKDRRAFGVTPLVFASAEECAGFKPGEFVCVSARGKGKGFAGVVKRWHFRGGPKTHGQKNRLRAPGSIGNTSPQRVIPGRHMAGRMGGGRITIKNIKVIEVNTEKNILFLHGATPGG